MSKHQVANLLRKYGTIDVIAKHFYALEDIADTQEETILEKDAEIVKKDGQIIEAYKQMNADHTRNMDLQDKLDKRGAVIVILKADVAESVDILKLITQSESMNKIVIEQAKAFIDKHNHAVLLDGDVEMKDINKKVYRTLNDWSNNGYRVNKGTKSHKRNEEGVCVFSSDQVTDRCRSGAEHDDAYDHDGIGAYGVGI